MVAIWNHLAPSTYSEDGKLRNDYHQEIKQ